VLKIAAATAAQWAAVMMAVRTKTSYTLSTLDVYSWSIARTRTNIEIDEVYVRSIMDRYGIHTKTEAVDLALRHLAGQPMTRDEAFAMEGAHAIGEVPPDRGPLGSKK
jgi:Arc/MetJ family transcription regulator